MKKIFCFCLILTFVTNFVVMAADIEVPANLSPKDIDDSGEIEITVEEAAVKLSPKAEVIIDGLKTNQIGEGIQFYVNCMDDGIYELKATGVGRFGAGHAPNYYINNSETPSYTKRLHPDWFVADTPLNLYTDVVGNINLNKGVNVIKLKCSAAHTNCTNAYVRSISLRLLDKAPVLGELTQSVNVPCIGDSLSISIEATDNNSVDKVEYIIGEDVVEMTNTDGNIYTADVILTNIGENVIYIKATDSAGIESVKTFVVNCVDYKVTTQPISTIVNGNVTKFIGNCTFANKSDIDSKQTCLIIAVYNSDNLLVGINYADRDVPVNSTEILETEVELEDVQGYRAELMIWDDVLEMNEFAEPICKW